MSADWDEGALRAALGDRADRFELELLGRCESTSERLRAAARAGAAAGRVVLADAQTAGRGRYGRRWESPSGQHLYLSVLWRPPPGRDGDALQPLTIVAAVAVREAILRVAPGVAPRFKWPNDLMIAGRKVSGILLDLEVVERGFAVVVGIGVNVKGDVSTLGEEVSQTATTLEAAAEGPVDRMVLAAEILRQLDVWYGEWEAHGPDAALRRWREAGGEDDAPADSGVQG